MNLKIEFCLVCLVKESGLILLQTIPNHIDIDQLRTKLLAEFRDIVNVHDLHVWQLTADRVYCTAHIIFRNPKVSRKHSKQSGINYNYKGKYFFKLILK